MICTPKNVEMIELLNFVVENFLLYCSATSEILANL